MLYFVRFGLIIGAAFALTACEGPTGPLGETGVEGPPGATGPQGPTGADGKSGHWAYDGTFDTFGDALIHLPIEAGTAPNVSLYIEVVGTQFWQLVPLVIPDTDKTVTDEGLFIVLVWDVDHVDVAINGDGAVHAGRRFFLAVSY